MSSPQNFPVIPPPPPPLPPVTKQKENAEKCSNFHPFEALWCSNLELQRTLCIGAKVALRERPVVCKFKDFAGLIQEGTVINF